jgi:hypothetical protein
VLSANTNGSWVWAFAGAILMASAAGRTTHEVPTLVRDTPTIAASANTTRAFLSMPRATEKSDTPSIRTSGVGSPERSAILDALRAPVESELHQKVKFEVWGIHVVSPFAGVFGKPVKPDGKAVDYSGTHFAEWIKEGVFDEHVLALLKKESGRWQVIEYEIGRTDWVGDIWASKYGVPKEIFSR